MDQWKEEQLRLLGSAQDEQELFELLPGLVRQLGYPYYRYIRLNPGASPWIKNNYPEEWNQYYQDHNLYVIDPVLTRARHSHMPVLWSPEIFAKDPAFWTQKQSFGMRHGWSQTVQHVQGPQSILCVARPKGEIDRREFYQKAGHILWLCNVLHSAAIRDLSSTPTYLLSPREVEVLKWSGEGKTAPEIARLLELNVRTVNFHIANAITKTGTTNKVAAMVAAIQSGAL
ncbi:MULTISPECIES: autoinducer binding domain-containing protein [unclassified Pseudomonas]|uniref:autoinducer binding domain-containing protein n=1 Tax=unclassified Pseudomonas TaxID=196821 RepID=UPI00128C6610|nr:MULTISPECIES: autoinducer binding domain-containing protein [unclassified Pseudomonas]MPQ68788.1 LuxR family transcriptional regulator [Pseudomonas sp. MWU12-2323]